MFFPVDLWLAASKAYWTAQTGKPRLNRLPPTNCHNRTTFVTLSLHSTSIARVPWQNNSFCREDYTQNFEPSNMLAERLVALSLDRDWGPTHVAATTTTSSDCCQEPLFFFFFMLSTSRALVLSVVPNRREHCFFAWFFGGRKSETFHTYVAAPLEQNGLHLTQQVPAGPKNLNWKLNFELWCFEGKRRGCSRSVCNGYTCHLPPVNIERLSPD